MDQSIYRDDLLIVDAKIHLVFVNKIGKPTKIPEIVLNNFEPRAKITQILADPDIDRNGYRLEIKFYVIGIQNPITVETFLERLR